MGGRRKTKQGNPAPLVDSSKPPSKKLGKRKEAPEDEVLRSPKKVKESINGKKNEKRNDTPKDLNGKDEVPPSRSKKVVTKQSKKKESVHWDDEKDYDEADLAEEKASLKAQAK